MEKSAAAGIALTLPESNLLLTDVHEGWKVEVVAYLTNGRRSQRLAELGLTPGTPARILRCARNQPLLLCVRGTHLAIDRNTAASLSVRVLQTVDDCGHGLRGWHSTLKKRRSMHVCASE